MVKGVTRRVIVIKSPDRRLFDEAIFIVREDARNDLGVTPGDIIKEAQGIADDYIRSNLKPGRLRKLPAPLLVLAGSMLTGLVWFLMWLLAGVAGAAAGADAVAALRQGPCDDGNRRPRVDYHPAPTRCRLPANKRKPPFRAAFL